MERLRKMRAFICDMDGVIYHGTKILPGAQEFVSWLKSQQKEYLFLTNSSEKTTAELSTKLATMGLDVHEDHFYTCALSTADFLHQQSPQASVFVIGGRGIIQALENINFKITDTNPDFVVVGDTRDYNFALIEKATNFVANGARLIGTNPDLSVPTEKGIAPHTGSIIAPIEMATGKKAYFLGKPNPLMMRNAVKRLSSPVAESAIIGDRMDTDIIAGLESGLLTVLVLSGVCQRKDVPQYPFRPDYIISGVGEIPRIT